MATTYWHIAHPSYDGGDLHCRNNLGDLASDWTGSDRMTYDPARLTQLGKRHIKLRDELRALVPELAAEIRAADAAGMPQVDIVAATGYTRDQVRQICLPPEKRRTRAKKADE